MFKWHAMPREQLCKKRVIFLSEQMFSWYGNEIRKAWISLKKNKSFPNQFFVNFPFQSKRQLWHQMYLTSIWNTKPDQTILTDRETCWFPFPVPVMDQPAYSIQDTFAIFCTKYPAGCTLPCVNFKFVSILNER